ncbi:hypothetical protein [Motilimonas sp. E26]|uniref:hypothetical protein n=1 Tax=Motilimonas sp. E26 TaxID=2865674 RepID=UPI001E36B1BA|nr:hypothetical protein [Motilimonas sp. E26]MCE0555686.1 hypothetical protein [Motilimonas sp. E26]
MDVLAGLVEGVFFLVIFFFITSIILAVQLGVVAIIAKLGWDACNKSLQETKDTKAKGFARFFIIVLFAAFIFKTIPFMVDAAVWVTSAIPFVAKESKELEDNASEAWKFITQD